MIAKATKFKALCRRTVKAHEKAIAELKGELCTFFPPKRKATNHQPGKCVETGLYIDGMIKISQ